MPEPGVRKKPIRSDLHVASSEAVRTAQELADQTERVGKLKAKLREAEAKLEPLKVAARGAEARYMQLRQRAYGQPPPPEDNGGLRGGGGEVVLIG